ncbi:MAG TPA: condensation domain-containing protein, partial [Aquella sp.]|nr:condensation domain-containing protein [Aquella sp.]
VIKFTGKLDKEKLKQACEISIQEHEVVHARYSIDGSKNFYIDFTIEDVYQEIILDKSIDIELYLQRLLSVPFNLTIDNLLGIFLLTVQPDVHYLVLKVHHVVLDGISLAMMLTEIAEKYNALKSNKDIPICTSKSLIDAVQAEQKELAGKNIEQAKTFWQNTLKDIPLRVELQKRYSVNQEQKNKQIYFKFSDEELQGLRKLVKETRSTLFLVLSAIYGLVLSKYSNQNQFAISYPVNMRPKSFANTMGCFVNNLPLVIDLNNKEILLDLIKDNIQQIISAEGMEWYSLTNIIFDQRKVRNEFQTDYFNVGFVETNIANSDTDLLNFEGIRTQAKNITLNDNGIYDLCLKYSVFPAVNMIFEYRLSVFDEDTANSFVNAIRKLVVNCKEYARINLNKINLLSKEEYQKVIYDWNKTQRNYPQDKTIHGLFEE